MDVEVGCIGDGLLISCVGDVDVCVCCVVDSSFVFYIGFGNEVVFDKLKGVVEI